MNDLQFEVGKLQDKVIKLQLLERADEKKWFLWIASGLLTATQLKTKLFPFFSRPEAIASFEKKFLQYTENRWVDREFFQQKQGKYYILSEERQKELLKLA